MNNNAMQRKLSARNRISQVEVSVRPLPSLRDWCEPRRFPLRSLSTRLQQLLDVSGDGLGRVEARVALNKLAFLREKKLLEIPRDVCAGNG